MKKKCPVKIGKHDLAVLSGLEYWGILGLGQIDGLVFSRELESDERTKLFFNETDSAVYVGYAYKRLLKLEKAGLIRKVSFVNFPKLYCITSFGHKTLTMFGRARSPSFRRSISPALVRHEVTVNAVGLTMREILGLDVRSELERISEKMNVRNLARMRSLVLSDLWVVDGDVPKAVEVELTQKSRGRYRKLWEVYDECMPCRGLVLYLAGWPGGMTRLCRFAQRFRAHRVRAGSLASFRADPRKCPFVGPEPGQTMTFYRRA
ncbi:MAG: hypothetical protein ABII00_09115 [Elusimicrobiota bacterium]